MQQSAVGANPGAAWHIQGAADLNGDGRADILWQHDNGQASVWLMHGVMPMQETAVGANSGAAWHIVDILG